MTEKIKVLVVRFNNVLAHRGIPLFRGAVVDAVGAENSVLFHNHIDEGMRYSYPLIQYKRIGGKAAIVCVGEGTEEIGKFFASCNFNVKIGEEDIILEVENVHAHRVLVQVWDTIFAYRVRKWLPLNQENYAKYMQMDSLADKYAMLENLLAGNILSMAKGLDIRFDKQVECKVVSVDEPRLITYKGVRMMAFDAEFKSNVSLPDYVGLGKGVSLGFGTVVRKYEKKNDNNE